MLMASARVGGPAVALVPTVACATAVVGDHAIDVILAVAFVTAAACVGKLLAHAHHA